MALGFIIIASSARAFPPLATTMPRSALKRPKPAPLADAARKGSFLPEVHPTVPPHTLLLGTQPSDNSLEINYYFASNENAFWHVVGDALGFRRGFHFGKRTEVVDAIRPHLLHDEEVTEYADALERLTSRGYCLWDLVESSERKGSLDSDIKNEVFADVGRLLAETPSITRVVFSTGKGSAQKFLAAHRKSDWLRTPGAFRAADDAESAEVFAKFFATLCQKETKQQGRGAAGRRSIELVVPESVSPASVPRRARDRAAQAKLGWGAGLKEDAFSRRPAHIYPVKRADWFAKVFHDEPLVKAAAKLGEEESHFRDHASASPPKRKKGGTPTKGTGKRSKFF